MKKKKKKRFFSFLLPRKNEFLRNKILKKCKNYSNNKNQEMWIINNIATLL